MSQKTLKMRSVFMNKLDWLWFFIFLWFFNHVQCVHIVQCTSVCYVTECSQIPTHLLWISIFWCFANQILYQTLYFRCTSFRGVAVCSRARWSESLTCSLERICLFVAVLWTKLCTFRCTSVRGVTECSRARGREYRTSSLSTAWRWGRTGSRTRTHSYRNETWSNTC